MPYTEKLQGAALAQKAMEDLIFHGNAASFKQSLTDLLLAWFTSDVDYDKNERVAMVLHYEALIRLLSIAEVLEVEKYGKRER